MSKSTNIDTDSSTNILRDNLILLLIFLGGVGIRFYSLGTESIWYDEAVSIAVAKLDLLTQIEWSFVRNDNNPPLYYALMHFWVWVFGDSEFAARAMSALFGSLTIIAIYVVGRLLFNRNVGLVAALILAVSVFHIKYSQEARSYSLLALLTLVSFYYYLKIISSERRMYAIGYLLSSALMLYTHYYGFLMLAAQNVFFFGNYFKNHHLGMLSLRRWLTYQVIIAITYLPGFVLLAKHAIAIQGGFWLPDPSLLGVLTLCVGYAGSLTLFILLLVFFFISIIGIRQIRARIGLKKSLKPILENSEKPPLSHSNRVYLLLLWIFIPIALPYLVSLVSTPILLYRYTIGCSLAFYILAALGISQIGNRKVVYIIAVLILVLSYFNLEKYYEFTNKSQWRETIAYIEENSGPGDSIVVYPVFHIEPANYYLERQDMRLYSLTDEFLLKFDAGNKNLWFVLVGNKSTENKRIEQIVNQRYDLQSQKQYKALNLYKYKKKGLR